MKYYRTTIIVVPSAITDPTNLSIETGDLRLCTSALFLILKKSDSDSESIPEKKGRTFMALKKITH